VHARIWGCRGSLATPGPATAGYGGNTSCVEVRLGCGELVILDAGSGIRELGIRLVREPPRTIHLCLTHLHLDHLEGLAFFAPIWRPDFELHVWGPPSAVRTLEQRIARYFSPPLFPMMLSDVRARITFTDVQTAEWEIGGALLRSDLVSHPGPTLGFRLEEGGRSLAYIPDHEPVIGGGVEAVANEWLSGYALAEGTDVLMHDAQYSAAEYETHIGWGHASVQDAVAFARVTGAGALLMFHHDPLHSDIELTELEADARHAWDGTGLMPSLAREGLELDLSLVTA
jgi:phosphoribosyl 1,2-cyclic phosphodiesterase